MEAWIEQVRAYLGQQGAIDASLHAFVSGFPTFALHGGMTIAILLAGVWIHDIFFTPFREIPLVRENNAAAGISYAGSIVSIAVPLSFAMATSLNWADILLWGVVTVLVQMIALRLVDHLILRDLSKRIREGEVAAACVLVGVKLAFGCILAAAVAGAPLARL